MIERCEICGEFKFGKYHRCAPIWMVADKDWPEEWEEVRARDAEEAAEKYVEKLWRDDADYDLPSDYRVLVRKVGEDPQEAVEYSVSGELTAVFHGDEVHEDDRKWETA